MAAPPVGGGPGILVSNFTNCKAARGVPDAALRRPAQSQRAANEDLRVHAVRGDELDLPAEDAARRVHPDSLQVAFELGRRAGEAYARAR
jgi:hypothetical protein